MPVKTFAEYLDAKNKLVSSPKVEKVADYHGPNDTKPAKSEMPKDAGGKGAVGTPAPYTNPGTAFKQKAEKGFADEGDKALVYEPKTDMSATKKVACWEHTRTQSWIEKTKGLPLSEFTRKIKTEANKGFGDDQELPVQAIKQVVEAARVNRATMTNLVRECKRNGVFRRLVAEMLQHPETYTEMMKIMESADGEQYARRLVRAMNEIVGPPAHKSDMDMPPFKKKHPALNNDPDNVSGEEFPPGDDDGEAPDDMGTDELDGEDMGGEEDMGDDDLDMGDEDDLDMGSEDDIDAALSGDENPDDMGSEVPPGSIGAMGDDKDMDLPAPHTKKKKHSHLMNAMKDSPMMGAMRSF